MAVRGGEHLGQWHDMPTRQEWPERLRVRPVAVFFLPGRGDREAMAGRAAQERVGGVRDVSVGRHVLSVRRVIGSGEPPAGIVTLAGSVSTRVSRSLANRCATKAMA